MANFLAITHPLVRQVACLLCSVELFNEEEISVFHLLVRFVLVLIMIHHFLHSRFHMFQFLVLRLESQQLLLDLTLHCLLALCLLFVKGLVLIQNFCFLLQTFGLLLFHPQELLKLEDFVIQLLVLVHELVILAADSVLLA